MTLAKWRFVALGLALVVGCASTPDQGFRSRAQDLRRRTMSAGGTASELTAIAHSGTVTQTEWQVNSALSESAFRTSLSNELEPEFSKITADDDRTEYTRFAGGDSEHLEITTISKDPKGNQYRIRFTS